VIVLISAVSNDAESFGQKLPKAAAFMAYNSLLQHSSELKDGRMGFAYSPSNDQQSGSRGQNGRFGGWEYASALWFFADEEHHQVTSDVGMFDCVAS